MRIAIAHCSHESNMFTPRRTTLEMFKAHEYLWGDDVVERHQGARTYLGGMIDEARERGVEIVPTTAIRVSPSPTIEAAAFDTITHDFLAGFEDAGHFDAICVGMHGAMAAENQLDPEGFLLGKLRERFGPQMPMAVTLDIHSNITDAMVNSVDGLFGSKVYPETDNYERGREAIAFLVGMVQEGVRPVKAYRYLPLLPQLQYTAEEPAKSIMELCRAQEHGNVLNCTLYFGFPGGDAPGLGSHVIVLANGDQAAAERAADLVATTFWARKAEFFRSFPTPEQAVQLAIDHPGRPVVIAESSDNPGGGSYGDATSLLRAMLDRAAEIRPAAFAFITDPETVEMARQIGVGGRFSARIGGKSEDAHSDPIEVEVQVKLLTDGEYTLTGPMRTGSVVQMGRTALLDVAGLDVVVASNEQPTQVFDPGPFRLHGIEPAECRVVGLKSTIHWLASYVPIASLTITAKGKGPFASGTRVYTQLREPLWQPS